MRSSFFLQKRRIVERQANPKLMLIHFHTFRHWKATTEQHKTKDPWHVKMILGHKSSSQRKTYIHLEEMLYDGDANDQFTVKVADTMDDAIKLMEVGFEYHAEIEGHKLFREKATETRSMDNTPCNLWYNFGSVVFYVIKVFQLDFAGSY